MAHVAQAALKAKSTWKLKASLSGAYGSTLYQFFDSSTRDGVVSLLDDIKVQDLTIEYSYEGKDAAKFVIDGKLFLGSLPLDLHFTHDKKGWEFGAQLSLNKDQPPETTVGAIVAHIFGPDVELPEFVASIKVKPPQNEQSVGLDIVSIDSTGSEGKDLLFTAWLDLSDFSFQAIQFQAAQKKGERKRPPVQRAFLATINSLPEVDIPLIGKLPQPFDEMLFCYVQPRKGTDTKPLGLTYKEVITINTKLAGKRKPLPYRVTKKKYNDGDVVIPSGAHFMLLRKNPKGAVSIVLDYVLGKSSSKASSHKGLAVVRFRATDGEPTEGGGDPGAAKAPYEKTIGPLSIRNMGLKFTAGSSPSLSILMDASIVLGPIGVGLLGFSLTISLKGATLHNLPRPGWAIEGLAVSFDRAPVILAGMFRHIVTKKTDAYQGAATVSFTPYLFEAAGYYGTTGSGADAFVSTFVYFILNGPLATLEFAEIRGVTGGFGYHTNLKFPDVTNVLKFPMIDVPPSTNPEGALDALMSDGWFFPQRGSFWIAAGLTILAFEILQVQAVLVVEWNPNIKFGLFGVATADMPAGAPEGRKFAHVQLGIVAVVDFNAGTLKIDGQLTPASYVLDPSCHLTGGFALFTWFASHDTAVAGDFVFTIGGYHRSYRAPTQYPNPPRLAISWSYDSSISIRGEAYFAITPKVCMGGGRLDAFLTLGPLYAFFDAYADFLINYKPFYFTAEGGLSVGVRFTLDLWICTVHLSVEIAATLYLQGPPIAGRVHVNFWVFGFDVDFGQLEGPPPQALTLEQFYQQVLQADLPKKLAGIPQTQLTPPGSTAAATESSPHIFSCNQGLIPSDNQKSSPNDTPWNVRGAIFQFTIGCKFAIEHATVITGQLDPHQPALPSLEVNGNEKSIYAKPMHLDTGHPLTSRLKVTITPVKPNLKTPKAEDAPPKSPRWDVGAIVIKSVPLALWGPYDPTADPNNPSNSSPNQNRDLLSGSAPSVALPMALQLSSPSPILSSDLIPPFPYKTFFTEDVSPEPYPFPSIPAADPAWFPEPEAPPSEQWEKVRAQWSGTPKLGEKAAEIAVHLWAALSFTHWDLTPVGAVSGNAPGKLLAKDMFQTLFLEAPRLGVING